MLVHRKVGRKEPLVADGIFALDLAEKRIDPAARADHLRHVAVAERLLEIVGHPRMDIPRLGSYLPILAEMIPLQDAAQRLLALHVGVVVVLLVVDRQHRDAARRMDVPRLQSETVAVAGIVVKFLQQVQIVVGAALVAFDGIVGIDDIAIVVVDVQFLVVVSVPEIVRRRGIDHARRTLPAVAAVGQTQELVEGRERPDALDVLQSESPPVGRPRRELDRTSQAAARLVDRRGAVQQRSVVDEVGGNHRKVGHAQHRRIDAHPVPRHLRVRRRRTAERHRRERGPAVLLDEDRSVESQHVGHRQGDVLMEHERVEPGFLHADLLHRTACRHTDLADRHHERGIVVPPPLAGFGLPPLLPVTEAGGSAEDNRQDMLHGLPVWPPSICSYVGFSPQFSTRHVASESDGSALAKVEKSVADERLPT